MNCQLVNDYMLDYCDGVLSPDLTIQIDAHIQTCKQCNINYRLTLIENEVLASPVNNDLSPEFKNNIMNIINNLPEQYTPNQKTENNKTKKPFYFATVAVAAVLMLMIIITPSSIFDNIKVANQSNINDSSKPEINIAKTDNNIDIRMQPLENSSKKTKDGIEKTNNMSYALNSTYDDINDSVESSIDILTIENPTINERNSNIANVPTPPNAVLDYQIIETIDNLSYKQYIYSNNQTIFNLFIAQENLTNEVLYDMHSNSYSWTFIYNDIIFKATIDSTLEELELEKIASSISFY